MVIKAIIHDWDDTITNSFESYTQFYFDFGGFYKLGNPDIEKIKEYWGGTIPEIVNGIWPELKQEEAEEKTRIFIENIKKWRKTYTPKVFPGIKETICKLNKLGVKLGIISSGDASMIKKIYREQIDERLRPYCFIYDNKELGFKKPEAKIFDRAFGKLSQFNIREQETIYVGDSFQDYYSAKNRGLKFYAVTTGQKSKRDFIKEELGSKYILSNFNEITNLFQ